MMPVTTTVKHGLPIIKDAPYLDPRKNPRRKQLDSARKDVKDLEDIHDANVLSVVFSREFLNSDMRIGLRYFKELITGKRLNAAKEALHQEELFLERVHRMYALTGEFPGSKSGVVKNEDIANAKSKEVTHAVKIAAAMALVYGKDDEQKKEIMLGIKNRYPELVEDIKSLVKKAKAQINRDEFRRATAGMKFGKGKPTIKNEFVQGRDDR